MMAKKATLCRWVNRFGTRVLPELVEHINPLRRREAVELEAALRDELRRAGITWVAGGATRFAELGPA